MVPTIGLSETSPAGTDSISAGDDRIREYKTQNREVLSVDHDYPTSGQSATAGNHKQVTLTEATDIGSGATGVPILGAQTIDDKPELVYTDEDDNDVQITKAGDLYPSQSTTLADWSAILNLIYPIGYVVTLGVSTNPGTLFGIGTWAAIEGKVIVGLSASGTFVSLDGTGGEETHLLTGAESGVPAHTHTVTGMDGYAAGHDIIAARNNYGGPTIAQASAANTAAAASSAHQNLQPYIVKHVWQRTA